MIESKNADDLKQIREKVVADIEDEYEKKIKRSTTKSKNFNRSMKKTLTLKSMKKQLPN